MKPITVEVSLGELVDKISILEIKSEHIAEADKLHNVRDQLAALVTARDRAVEPSEALAKLTAELRAINEELWDIEDEIRLCERSGAFGPRFIELARSIYRQNDRRTAVKREINKLFGSKFTDEKAYPSYSDTGSSLRRG
ncbi:MAG: DUF6165 family protein [Acidobacteria bacterium]|nr:DUF6165 family protein [Acidobacteriota bacterium]